MFASSYLAKETGNVPSPASGLIATDIEHSGVTWLIEEKHLTVVQRFSGTLSHTRLREDLPSLTVDAFSHFAFSQSNNTYVFADLQGRTNVVWLHTVLIPWLSNSCPCKWWRRSCTVWPKDTHSSRVCFHYLVYISPSCRQQDVWHQRFWKRPNGNIL